ncbi:MAG: SusC/RagA family TonB-linked outer membrane protein [Fermentimonas sp.]
MDHKHLKERFFHSPFQKRFPAMKWMFLLLLLLISQWSVANLNREARDPIIAATESHQQQKRTITGTVVDAAGVSIIGANVIEIGTTNGTVTDVDGKFSLSVADNATIRITYIGYLEQDISTGGRTVFNITLLEDTRALDEIVVVGYGTQRKVNLTGSIAVVDSKTLQNRPITNSSQALQGVKGLYVNQAGGAQPGADGANITIRGITSIGGASKLRPLILVDGVELSLDNVNPNDIESISVLKDAASTAIYGSRAANGVILVTTKKGQENDLSVVYSGYIGFQEATYLPDPVDNSADFMELYNKAQINQGTAPYYSQELINEFRQNPTSLIHPNTNWMKLMFGKAPITEHNVRVSGGNNKTKFNLSAGILDHEGILRKGLSSADRYNLNIRVSSKINDRFNLEGSLMGTIWKTEEPAQGISTFMNRLMRMVPLQPTGKLENGNWADSWVITPGQNSFQSPLVWGEEAYRYVDKYNSTAVLSAKYDIIKGLSFQTMGSYNNEHMLLKNWYPMIQLYDPRNGEPRKAWSGTSTKTHQHDYYEHLNLTNTLHYETVLKENHSISTLLGASFEKYSSNYMNARIQGFPTMDLQELNLGTSNQAVTGNSSLNSLISYFGRIQYSYQDKYLFEANGRYDGSSKFSQERRWGFFPSFSLGWRISEEPFAQDINGLDELKIRSSWGQIGNQEIGLFQYVNAVALGYGYPFGGVYNAGAAIIQSRDPNIRWETTTITNLGVDWVILKGMLSGEIEVFNKKTSDILRGIALPAQVGALSGPTTNVATVENKGVEIGLTHRNQITKSFSYEVGANFSRIKNKVIDLKGERIISGSLLTEEGSPINSWYVLKTDGLFKTQEEVDNYPTITSRVGPGDIKYVDLNGDGKIDGNDRYIAGNTFPDFTYGFNFGFDYKRFSLTTLWQGVQNISVRPNFNMASPFNNGAGVTKDWLTDSWTPENPNARLPRISCRNQYTAENFSDSDFWLEDASYLRLKNIQLSYRIEGDYLSKLGLKQVVIFTNAQNFLTFSNVRHFDPERNITQTNINQYPTAKTVTFGINLNF